MKAYPTTLQFLQNFLADVGSIVDAVQSGDVHNPEADLLAGHLKGSAFVKIDIRRHLLKTVGHTDGGIAGK
jgi:hypothetical protein